MKKFSRVMVAGFVLAAMLATVAAADCGDKVAKDTQSDVKSAAASVQQPNVTVKCDAKAAAACAATSACADKALQATKMGQCCIDAAQAGKGCCGKDAETVKAAFADYQTAQAAKADMHKCCADALDFGKGCCGKDAEGLKAAFAEKVAHQQAMCAANADMHKCCAEAVAAGKGCCGKDAAALRADYDKKVQTVEKKLASG